MSPMCHMGPMGKMCPMCPNVLNGPIGPNGLIETYEHRVQQLIFNPKVEVVGAMLQNTKERVTYIETTTPHPLDLLRNPHLLTM